MSSPPSFLKGNQSAVWHDAGDPAGFFHTYDALTVGQDAPRKIHVFLPRDYETSRDRYPVIYMNDGDTAFFRGGAINESWFMGSVLSQLQAAGAMEPVIVVAIYPRDRNWEYTHTNIGLTRGGGIATYAQFVAQDLKGFIDTYYRTQPERDRTLILGSSHGGLAAYLMGMLQPQAFGNVAACSPSFWVGLDSNPLALPLLRSLAGSKLLQLSASTLADPTQRPRLYLDWGLMRDGQFHNDFIEARTTTRGRQLRDLLIQRYGYELGRSLVVVEEAQGEHSEKSWHRRVPALLQLFYGQGASTLTP